MKGVTMQIVLLSGGSGKRLWPLSNEIRSKQFIKLFKNDNNEYESMVQRVYRQIRAVDPDTDITIATSNTQVSSLRNQLGDNISICAEPCRRDTCPAILLTASYLHDELHVKEEETVIVCPVDPYVENSYYEAVFALGAYVQAGKANLILLGIEPTVPSNKYGYIIPETTDRVARVKAFKEKPNVKDAEKYLADGALWNAGVFACKLGYLLDVAYEIAGSADYKELFIHYENLEKISFDYAVVEKEQSIQVLRYAGEWRDVGTWNMMAEVMSEPVKGNVILDETCENNCIINEQEVPLLCMGCKNMVIAASSDGIFVADKKQSGTMKQYVEKISTDVHYAEKSWGTYNVIDIQKGAVTVKVSLYAGHSMSYHSHEYRNEIWTVLAGEGVVTVDEITQDVHSGDVVSIAAGCKHSILADTDMQLIEVQVGSVIDVADKVVY